MLAKSADIVKKALQVSKKKKIQASIVKEDTILSQLINMTTFSITNAIKVNRTQLDTGECVTRLSTIF